MQTMQGRRQFGMGAAMNGGMGMNPMMGGMNPMMGGMGMNPYGGMGFM